MTGLVSADGASWRVVGTTTLNIGTTAYVGLAVTSADPSRLNTSTFDNVAVAAAGSAFAASAVPGSPWEAEDVGAVNAPGSSSYANGVFTSSGAGTIWGTSDTFRFIDRPISGDVTIVARVTSLQDTNTFAKAGIMLRESAAADAAHVILNVRPTGDLEFMTRSGTAGATRFLATAFKQTPTWLRLERSGNVVTASLSLDGNSWTTVGSTALEIGSAAVAGLVVGSAVANTPATATFDNVVVR
jgi:regulation of enolase protein 1 (concanavalin A-like superfamily)